MNYTCPLCGTNGEISGENLKKPVTRATCRQCEAILFVDPDSGEVENYKSPVKDSPQISRTPIRSSESVTDIPAESGVRDWPAIVAIGIVLALLCAAGIYLVIHLDWF